MIRINRIGCIQNDYYFLKKSKNLLLCAQSVFNNMIKYLYLWVNGTVGMLNKIKELTHKIAPYFVDFWQYMIIVLLFVLAIIFYL